MWFFYQYKTRPQSLMRIKILCRRKTDNNKRRQDETSVFLSNFSQKVWSLPFIVFEFFFYINLHDIASLYFT